MNNTYQQILYNLSVKAYKKGEVPVAALLVKDGKVISKAYNTRHNKKRLLGHAEINCILKGTSKLKTWILSDCDLYVTLEPCNMCKEIINEARIRNVFYYVSMILFFLYFFWFCFLFIQIRLMQFITIIF